MKLSYFLDCFFNEDDFGVFKENYLEHLRAKHCKHEWEDIVAKHDFIHPPKCKRRCGYSMSPEERINHGLDFIKQF